MPTGYTDIINKGVTFKEFVMSCARGMGACITMRDDPSDAEIPVFEPSTYHKGKIEEANTKIENLKKLTISKAAVLAKKEYDEETSRVFGIIKANNELKAKYNKMLEYVNSWQPPTSDHDGLKKFMVEQITRSVDFDCDNTYYIEKMPKLLIGEAWLEKETVRILKNIIYHTKEDEEENKRVNARNLWIAQLKNSL